MLAAVTWEQAAHAGHRRLVSQTAAPPLRESTPSINTQVGEAHQALAAGA